MSNLSELLLWTDFWNDLKDVFLLCTLPKILTLFLDILDVFIDIINFSLLRLSKFFVNVSTFEIFLSYSELKSKEIVPSLYSWQ